MPERLILRQRSSQEQRHWVFGGAAIGGAAPDGAGGCLRRRADHVEGDRVPRLQGLGDVGDIVPAVYRPTVNLRNYVAFLETNIFCEGTLLHLAYDHASLVGG